MNSQEKLKQNVKVYVRPRPQSRNEIDLKLGNVIHHTSHKEIIVKQGFQERKYHFDEVFNNTSSQEEVYNVVVGPLIDYTISGYNCTVFAYGQTGTGKTHTMIGQNIGPNVDFHSDPGVGMIPRAASHLFSQLSKLNAKMEYTVKVSFIEIYNEEVRDLLTPESPQLRVYDDPENKGSTCIKGVTEATVCNTSEVHEWLNMGNMERQTAATNLNRQSSRSHTLFTMMVYTREVTVDGEEVMKTGKLHLVDLAGSENIGRSGATEMRAREAGTINKSLLTLGKVIKALAQKMQHVPYRDSKLTRILQDSLGGKTKTCMLATISPCAPAWDETISTLEYANVARNVANCPQVNVNRKQANLIQNMNEEIVRLRKELTAARNGTGFYISQDSYDQITLEIDQKTGRLMELVREVNRLEEEQVTLGASFTKTRDYLKKVEETLTAKEKELQEKEYMLKYMDKRDNHLTTKAKKLIQVCETSTTHADILHRKFEKERNLNIENVDIIRNIANTGKDCLNTIGESLSKLSSVQQGKLKDLQAEIKVIGSQTSGQVFPKLQANKKDLQVELNANLDFDTVASDPGGFFMKRQWLEFFENIFTSLQTDDLVTLQTELKGLQDFCGKPCMLHVVFEAYETVVKRRADFWRNKQQLDEKRSSDMRKMQMEFEEMKSKLAAGILLLKEAQEKSVNIENHLGDIKETLVETGQVEEEEKTDLSMQNLQIALTDYKKFSDESATTTIQRIKTCADSVSNFKDNLDEKANESMVYLIGFTETVEENLEKINTDKQVRLSRVQERNEAIEQISKSTLTNVENLATVCDHMGKLDKQQNAKIQKYCKVTVEGINHCENRITNIGHSGDTPARQRYSFPRKIKNKLPTDVLRERFQENVENLSFNLTESEEDESLVE